MVSTLDSERIEQARIVEVYVRIRGMVCSGFGIKAHPVCCPRINPLVVVPDAVKDEHNVLCRICAERRAAAA